MSLLEMVGSILTELEKVQEKLDRLLASGNFDEDTPERVKQIEAMDRFVTVEHDGNAKSEVKLTLVDEPETKEGAQDLTQVLLFNETPKAFLVVKHGFQVWVAKSHLEDAAGYDLGNTYDLKVKEKSKWVLKKLNWKPFEVFKD